MRRLTALSAFLALLVASTALQAAPVGTELALLVDVSGSVDDNEFALQRGGYVSAFQNATVQNAIIANGGIAVTYVQWSGAGQQAQSIGWTLVNSVASANAFATTLAGTGRAFTGNTAPGSAINFAINSPGVFGASNGFEGIRNVIDVSGDGAENEGDNTAAARTNALANGINAINGLPILGEGGLLAFYQNSIQGGANSFTLPANSFAEFQAAIVQKLINEIQGGPLVPEPASMLLWSIIGGAACVTARLRRRS